MAGTPTSDDTFWKLISTRGKKWFSLPNPGPACVLLGVLLFKVIAEGNLTGSAEHAITASIRLLCLSPLESFVLQK